MLVRTPTDLEYFTFDGDQSRRLWINLDHDWCCPGCNRTKRQLMKWVDKKRKWIGSVQTHHCHNSDWNINKRFERTIVCIDCNSADSAVKRTYNLKHTFSFAPWEIRQFVKPQYNASHVIDYKVAKRIYELSVIADVQRGLFPVACNACYGHHTCKTCSKIYKQLNKSK